MCGFSSNQSAMIHKVRRGQHGNQRESNIRNGECAVVPGGKMTQQEFAAKSQEIESIMKENGAEKAAPVVTTMFSVEQGIMGPVMDVEILVPLNKEIPVHNGYMWKSRFLLTNAVKLHHVGHPSALQNSVNELNAYISGHHLAPITSGYNVTVKEPKTPLEMDVMEIDVYVGVNPNSL